MSQNIEVISGKVTESYKSTIRSQESIDSFLDQINQKKESYQEIINNISKINELLCELTWVDEINESDKVLLKGVIAMGEHTDKTLRFFYADQRRKYHKLNLFKKEFKALIEVIEIHNETISDVNNVFINLRDRDQLEKCGLILSGIYPEENLVEIVEIEDHPWFLGCQFHPEFKSRPMVPHPLFESFVGACYKARSEQEQS